MDVILSITSYETNNNHTYQHIFVIIIYYYHYQFLQKHWFKLPQVSTVQLHVI